MFAEGSVSVVIHVSNFIYDLFLAARSNDEIQEEEMDMFTKLYTEWKGTDEKKDATYATIPKFYYKVSKLILNTSPPTWYRISQLYCWPID